MRLALRRHLWVAGLASVVLVGGQIGLSVVLLGGAHGAAAPRGPTS